MTRIRSHHSIPSNILKTVREPGDAERLIKGTVLREIVEKILNSPECVTHDVEVDDDNMFSHIHKFDMYVMSRERFTLLKDFLTYGLRLSKDDVKSVLNLIEGEPQITEKGQ